MTLLKLSAEDAEWLGGTPRQWLAAGPAAVVVTRGGAGLTAYTRDGGEYTVPGERVDVVDTIGAGDTVNAALLHGLAQRDALSASALAALGAEGWRGLLGFAARAAAVTCSRAARNRRTPTRWPAERRRHRPGLRVPDPLGLAAARAAPRAATRWRTPRRPSPSGGCLSARAG